MSRWCGERVRVLRVITRLNVGGPSIHVVNLVRHLSDGEFDSRLVVGFEGDGEGSMFGYAFSRGVFPLLVRELGNGMVVGPNDLKALWRLYVLIRGWRPHIVHTHTMKAGFLGRIAARLAGVPVVVHTFHGHVFSGYFGRFRSDLFRRLERWLGRLTDRVVAVSPCVRDELISYGIVSFRKIEVIPLGFDLTPFLVVQRGGFRSEFGLSEGVRLVGIVGRLFPIKNHRLFFDAAHLIVRRCGDVRFVVVGDGVLRSELEAYVRALGISDRVIFTGWRFDIARIQADLDVLVVSSNNEGTPVSAIEAMASGTPVVATRVGGVPDIIEDGRNGFLVPPGDAEALSEAVLRVLEDRELALRMGSLGRQMALERFSLDRLIEDVRNLYLRLLVND